MSKKALEKPAPKPAAIIGPDTVGRAYTKERWGVHTMMEGGEGIWYGRSNYRSLDEAMEYFRKIVGKRGSVEMVGGIPVSFVSDRKTKYFVRVTHEISQCQVVQIGIQIS